MAFDFKLPFQRKVKTITPEGKVSLPITREVVEKFEKPFKYVREWTCGCGNNLRIRARDHREDGPSNFKKDVNGRVTLSHGELNWNGLAEEKGWNVNPVQCPACIAGMSTEEYKMNNRAAAEGLSFPQYLKKLADSENLSVNDYITKHEIELRKHNG